MANDDLRKLIDNDARVVSSAARNCESSFESPTGHDPLRELHDLLYMAQRIEGGQRDRAISRARVIVHHLRANVQSCLTPEELKGASLAATAATGEAS
jgi:hypothetical protein